VLLCALVLGQQTSEDCRSRVKFENRNQVDPKPLFIRALSGSILDRDRVPIPQICLGLFTEEGHQLVASTVSDDSGQYRFTPLPRGRYRLIAKVAGFCTASVPLRLVGWPRGGLIGKRRIVVHMELPRIDHCSYADFK